MSIFLPGKKIASNEKCRKGSQKVENRIFNSDDVIIALRSTVNSPKTFSKTSKCTEETMTSSEFQREFEIINEYFIPF